MFDLTLWQIILMELGVAAIAASAAHLVPWQALVGKVEERSSRLASKARACFFGLALLSVGVRLATLPLKPVPQPLFHDEFSYMLGADTFAHGRLTNPAPTIPIAFESIHLNVTPTYQSMYLPGTALVLSVGSLLGSSWIAVLLLTALLPATIYWMAAGWLPRGYALLAGVVTIVITSNLNWWFDNYFCIALTSLGTSLVLGSIPRIAGSKKALLAFLLGLGLSCLILSRPYEGFCVTLPCVAVLLWKLRDSGARTLTGLLAAASSLPAVSITWLLYYNWRGTGNPLLFPYMLNLARYHITSPFLFSRRHVLPSYDLDILRRFYIFAEVSQYDYSHSHPFLFLAKKISAYYIAVLFGFGTPLCFGVAALIRARRKGLWASPLFGLCGLAINILLMAWAPFPQYIAPAFPLLMLLVALGALQLRKMPFGRITGVHLTRGFVLAQLMLALSLFGFRVSDARDFPEPQYVSKDRSRVLHGVLNHPGKQLCLVRYTPLHESWQEWVFNGADLYNERVMWARSLDAETDRAVIAAYPDRTVWLVKPDFANDLVSPYDPDAPFPLMPPPAPKR